MIRLDANYILRYLINDDQAMAEEADRTIAAQTVFMADEIIAEVIYVLDGVYQVPRNKIAALVSQLLSLETVLTSHPEILQDALGLFGESRLDFVDCLLCAHSKYDEIKTFDQKLLKCIAKKQSNTT